MSVIPPIPLAKLNEIVDRGTRKYTALEVHLALDLLDRQKSAGDMTWPTVMQPEWYSGQIPITCGECGSRFTINIQWDDSGLCGEERDGRH